MIQVLIHYLCCKQYCITSNSYLTQLKLSIVLVGPGLILKVNLPQYENKTSPVLYINISLFPRRCS